VIDGPPPKPAVEIVAPAANEVSFGRVVVRVPRNAARVRISASGRVLGVVRDPGRRVKLRVKLPRGDLALRVAVFDRQGRKLGMARVGHVYGLPQQRVSSSARRLDRPLARKLNGIVASFDGAIAYYVQDLTSGRGAARNAGVAFPAASTLKLAIGIAAMRQFDGPPEPGSLADILIRRALIYSDNEAANALETLIGGSTTGGSALVNALMRDLGLTQTDMYGGYLTGGEGRRARAAAAAFIPIAVRYQPTYPTGKRTTAADLGRLTGALHHAALGRGPLAGLANGRVSPREARYLLYVLLHSSDPGSLGDLLPASAGVAQKSGWLATVRHVNGVVYTSAGTFVATVLTWHPRSVSVVAAHRAAARLSLAMARYVRRDS